MIGLKSSCYALYIRNRSSSPTLPPVHFSTSSPIGGLIATEEILRIGACQQREECCFGEYPVNSDSFGQLWGMALTRMYLQTVAKFTDESTAFYSNFGIKFGQNHDYSIEILRKTLGFSFG